MQICDDEEINKIFNNYMAANPIYAHSIGIHEYDGVLPDLSKENIEQRVSVISSDLEIIRKKLQNVTDKLLQFEYSLIKYRLETEKFQLAEHKEFTKSPVPYIFPLAIVEMSYTARSFDTPDNRIRYIINIEKQIPRYLEIAKENLMDSIASVKLSMGLAFLDGIIEFYNDSLISFVIKSNNEELIEEWSQANIKAVEAMQGFRDDLINIYQPKAHNDFRLGREKFLQLLNKTENVELDIEKLLSVGMEDLELNYQTMKKIIDERGMEYLENIDKDHPTPEQLVEETKGTLERTMNFLIEKDIVDLPTTEQCEVIETPKFARKFAFAAMSTPGPFEKEEASESYYWITPPDTNAPPEMQEQFMRFFSRAFLENITVHEVWPGHYLQLLYNKISKSEIAKAFARSTSMIEGWAHYSEEMIYQEGYEPFDRTKLHVGQLRGALTRNCRFISAIKMHCFDMTVEESTKLFQEKAFMTLPTAKIEANRGTIDPMYLNYTLGKLLIKKLRDDHRDEIGEAYSLKEFHKLMLSYGSPPIVALRNLLLENTNLSVL